MCYYLHFFDYRFYRGFEFALFQGPLARFGSVAANELSNMVFAFLTSDSPPDRIDSTGKDFSAVSHNEWVRGPQIYNESFTHMGRHGRDDSPWTPALRNIRRILSNPLNAQLFSTFLGGLVVTAWRALLMPIDTCKTVAQVEGGSGLRALLHGVWVRGDPRPLYAGTLATLLAAFIGHYPWFFVHNTLELALPKANGSSLRHLLRNALIGFSASAVSDAITNSFRIVKTIQQTTQGGGSTDGGISYMAAVLELFSQGGWYAVLGRGLMSRLLSNGLQSIVFVVVWKYFIKYFNERGQRRDKKRENSFSDSDGIV